MSIPKPPLDLTGHCSAVFNNTVYAFSPAGFQSLTLSQGAEWQTLSPGVSVTGGICVPGGDSLFIVGGTPNATSASYSGLQQYSFSDNTWETITPIAQVTQNRQYHGAAYINSSSSIVVYAGSQTAGDNGPSSQTFLISTIPPYAVLSFSSQGAPPLVSPMIMPWDTDHVLMIGGSATNQQVFTFGQPEGWVNLGTTLANPISDPTTTQCTLVTGDDQSKVLEIYDMGVSPNQVTEYALWANGGPAAVGDVVGAPTSSKNRRRDLTVSNWPAYNSTLAPTDTRSGYALAESSDGLVIITGGDSANPIAIFDQRENTWVNATSLLVEKNQVPLSSPTSTSLPSVSVVVPIATSTSAPASTSAAAGGGGGSSSHSKVLTVLGGTLGAIFGLAAILILILVLLRHKREKKKNTEEEYNEKDGRLSFADQGAEFMHEAGGSRGRAYSESINGSVSSLQIFNKPGSKSKVTTTKVNTHKRGMPSDSSQLGLVKAKSPLGINEPLEMSHISGKTTPTHTTANSLAPSVANSSPRPKHVPIAVPTVGPDEDPERSRSNGWSRYFANNEVTNLASMQSGRSTYGTDAETYRTSESRSEYEDPRNMSNSSVRPLELNLGPKFDGQRLSRVATGSPTMGLPNDDLREGLSAEIRRAESISSRGSNPGFTYTSSTRDGNSTRDGPTTWTPVSNTEWSDDKHKTADTKSIGSVYSNSGNPYFSSGTNPYHTNDPTQSYFSKKRTAEPAPTLPDLGLPQHNFGDNRDSQASQITVFPSGVADSPKLSAFPRGILAQKQPSPHDDFDFPMPQAYFGNQHRDSTASNNTVASNVTVFPRGVPSPTATSFPRPKLVDAKSPPVPPVPPVPEAQVLRRGPVIRKTTGDEDMSWLNINAGRAI
jgi:hypothetical protein